MLVYKINSSLTSEERETILRYDYLEKCWYMETSISTHWNKALKQKWEVVSKTVNEDNKVQSMVFKCDNPSSISIRGAEKKKRTLTDEQKEKLRNQLKKT